MATWTTMEQRIEPDPLVRQTIADLTLSRATGAPFLALLTGVRSVPTAAARSALSFDPRRPSLSAGAGLLDVAMLADLALGAALRRQVGGDRLLATITLTLHLGPATPYQDVAVPSSAGGIAHGVGAARGEFVRDGQLIGQCLATFAVGAGGAAATPLPWERSAPPPDAVVPPGGLPDALTPDEREVLAAVGELARAGTGDGRSWSEELVAQRCMAGPSGGSVRLRPSLAMRNRAGRVQGAVLFGLACASAVGTVTPVPIRTVSGHLEFLASAAADAPIDAEPVLLRATRQLFFVRSDLRQGDRLVASASFVFQRQP
ncbi:MAG: acyl-CoA thioesterase domain-containing protein [Micromonospora sp.]